jgi:hypothetical protein
MSIAEPHTARAPRIRRRKDERDYAWMFWTAFPIFLAFAVFSRLRPRRGDARSAGPRRSIFREAWIAANSSIPFAFH